VAKMVNDEDLQAAVNAYYEAAGNKAEAARSLGLKRTTFNDRLGLAETKLKIKIGKVADGRVNLVESSRRDLPKKGHVKRYILTSIQNNTHLHPGFNNLLAYNEWLNDLPKGSCELIIGTYTYQKAAYGAKAVKRGTFNANKDEEDLWYAREAEQYIVDESLFLAPGLIWCGEMNILPTTKYPLDNTNLTNYNGRKSNVFPHTRIAMSSVASMADEATKLNYTTGTVTQLNYIQKMAGIVAERNHCYGALLVEVDDQGSWFCRQLHIDEDDAIMDIGPEGSAGVHVQLGQVEDLNVVTGVYCGDTHVAEMDPWVRKLMWGNGGMLDTLKPEFQFHGDIFSMRSRSHHELKSLKRIFQKHIGGEASVEEEIKLTVDFANEANRDWCEMVLIPSNHHRHLEQWIEMAKSEWWQDPANIRYYLQLALALASAIEGQESDFDLLEYAMTKAGLDKDIRFLAEDESFQVCGVENGLHGDLGPNGSRGSTKGLTKLGRPLNKGHDHTAAIRDEVYSAGVCGSRFVYQKGPSSHSVSHIVIYKNGKRALVTMFSNKWRA
jgi:hypothetical protein